MNCLKAVGFQISKHFPALTGRLICLSEGLALHFNVKDFKATQQVHFKGRPPL